MPWRLYLLAGAGIVAAFYLFATAEVVASASAYVGFASAATIVVCVVRYRPPRGWAWLALALGVLLQGAGDFVWSMLSPTGVEVVPAPSAADAVYLVGYVALIAGLIGLVRRRNGDGDLATLIDVGILSVGLGVLAWVLLVEPAVAEIEGPFLAVAVTAAYPLLDLALSILLLLAILSRNRGLSLDLLTLAFIGVVASDVAYLRGSLDGSYVGGGAADLGWFAGYLLWGAAALHPSARRIETAIADAASPRFSHPRAAALGAACLVAPLATAIAFATGQVQDVLMFQAASAVMIVLWAVRVAVTVGHLRRTLDERRVLEGRLRDQAERDPLLGLLNRSAFRERLSSSLRAGEPVAVLYLDLDDFKVINDTFGHVAGDAALVQVAQRVTGALGSADVAARLGGDEFGLLVPAVDADMPVRVATDVLDALLPPLNLDGRTVYLRGSIGISYGAPGMPPEELMREADVAMYLAKGNGKARFQVFEATMHDTVMRRLALRSELEHAIANREFVVHYQPIVAASRDRLFGSEALVRWQHPTRGLLAPDEFIALAEETGLIVPLGRLVLEDACREAAAWSEPDATAAHVSINVSGVQLRDPGFEADVARVLAETGLDPRQLILEVTESTLIHVENAGPTLAGLRRDGIRIAVDDFGTGYSSLAYLARYPLDILKIDGAFVAALGTGAREDRLTAAIVGLSHDLHVQVIAEGVETEAQLERLADLGCAWVQGYFFARAMPARAIREFIRDWPDSTTTSGVAA